MPKPLVKSIPYAPAELYFAKLESTNAVWLDSASVIRDLGRYSYICVEPYACHVLKGGRLNGQPLQQSALETLAGLLDQVKMDTVEGLPPFQGGLAGFISYDFAWYLEDLPNIAKDDMGFEDWILGVYDVILAFDHQVQQAWIISTGAPCEGETERLAKAQARLSSIEAQLNSDLKPNYKSPIRIPASNIKSTHDKAEYIKMVEATMDYIRAGDIFEANVTQRFSAPFGGDALQLYAQLRQCNPAPFAACLNFEHTQILSASPERFLKLQNRMVETRPIKGTMARSLDPVEDEQRKLELVASTKDCAENIMIVDLMRNDLSRVCQAHSVKVHQLCAPETFATVHHLVSGIQGELKPGMNAADLVCASFPGGSITGAPKLRAMEIIESFEPYKRGPYCGSIGYFGFNGDMDLNIVIRTFAIKNQRLTFAAGGAITLDSDPEQEYEESLAKAFAMRKALEGGKC